MSYPGDQVTASPDQWRRRTSGEQGYAPSQTPFQDPDVPTARRARPARHASSPPPGAPADGPGPAAPGDYAPPAAGQFSTHPSGPFPAPPRGGFATHPSGPLPIPAGTDFSTHPSGPFPAAPADEDPPARGRRHSGPDARGEDGGGSIRGRSRSRSEDRSERPKRGRRKSAGSSTDRAQRELGDWRETDDSDGPDFSGMFMSAPAWEDTGDPPGPSGGTGVAFAEPADDFSDLSDESLAAWTAGFADLRINAHVDKRRPSVTKPPRTSPPSTTRPPRATPPGISKPPRSRGPKAALPKPSKRSGRTRSEPEDQGYAPPAEQTHPETPPAEQTHPETETRGYAPPAKRTHRPETEDHGHAPPAEPQERRDGRVGRRRRPEPETQSYAPPAPRRAPEPETQGYAPPAPRRRAETEDHGYAPPRPRRAPEQEHDTPRSRLRHSPEAGSFALPSRRAQAAPQEPDFADAEPFAVAHPFTDTPPFTEATPSTEALHLETLAPVDVPELAPPAEFSLAPLADPGFADPVETMIAPAEHDAAPVKQGVAAAGRTRAAKAADRKASRRKGNRWVMAGAGLSVIAVLAAVVYLVYPSGTPQPAAVSHPSSFSAAQAATNPTPSAAPSGWQHIASRSADSAALTLTQLFPAQFAVSGASYTRTIEQGTSDCAKALFGVSLQSVAHTNSCNQVMRATYLSSSQNVMGTIGVLNLATSAGATKVGKATGANGFISQLVGPSGPTHNLDKGTGLAEAEVKGHYLILTWVEFANLKTPKSAAQKTQLRTFSANLIDQTANVSLTNRMVTGEP